MLSYYKNSTWYEMLTIHQKINEKFINELQAFSKDPFIHGTYNRLKKLPKAYRLKKIMGVPLTKRPSSYQ